MRLDIPVEEHSFKKEYFEKWLTRDTKSGKRPSANNPEHLGLYWKLLEELAAKVLREGLVDSDGLFAIHDDDVVEYDHLGQRRSFPAHRVINRSSVKQLDPRTSGDSRYRFEPVWLHCMLMDACNRRISSTTTSARGE